VKSKTAPYADCGRRFRFRELYEVTEDHVTWFAADELCEEGAIASGIL
jgi:hypothetical protein